MECQKEKILAESKVLLLFLKLTLKVNGVVSKLHPYNFDTAVSPSLNCVIVHPCTTVATEAKEYKNGKIRIPDRSKSASQTYYSFTLF